MSDARWLEIERDARAAVRHFSEAVTLFEEDVFSRTGIEAYRAEMALMHSMQSGHTSLEALLTRILMLFDEEPPQTKEWHSDIIQRAAVSIGLRPAFLDARLANAADETRRFRHRAAHNYDNFQHHRATPSIDAAKVLSAELLQALGRFRQAVDP